ncbi:hypothetical protein JCM10908_006668 [Rhodotorula pacifica]|uniref:uncharacterized protein n=1 Tax=Rhodotorula pacifica TaxID=1495444 RepID=UPI0031804B7F
MERTQAPTTASNAPPDPPSDSSSPPKRPQKRVRWTGEDDDKLLRMADEKCSHTDMAATFGRTVIAISAHLGQLRKKRQAAAIEASGASSASTAPTSTGQSGNDDAFATPNFSASGAASTSSSHPSIFPSSAPVPSTPTSETKRNWTTEDDETLRALRLEGKANRAIGEVLGRSEGAVAYRLSTHHRGLAAPTGGNVNTSKSHLKPHAALPAGTTAPILQTPTMVVAPAPSGTTALPPSRPPLSAAPATTARASHDSTLPVSQQMRLSTTKNNEFDLGPKAETPASPQNKTEWVPPLVAASPASTAAVALSPALAPPTVSHEPPPLLPSEHAVGEDENDDGEDVNGNHQTTTDVRTTLGGIRFAPIPLAAEFNADEYATPEITTGHVYEWLTIGTAHLPPIPVVPLVEAVQTGDNRRAYADPFVENGVAYVRLTPRPEFFAQDAQDAEGGPLCRRLVNFINSRLASPTASHLHFIVAGDKAQHLIDILIAANTIHHELNRLRAGGSLPPNYDASPFFTFTILERPKSGENTDHSKLKLFSRCDMQALTVNNGSANLSAPGMGAVGMDRATDINRNISHEVMQDITIPSDHPDVRAIANIFDRHVVLRAKAGLLRPLEPFSWALTPTTQDRKDAQHEREQQAAHDKSLQALEVPIRPYDSSYALNVPTAAERQTQIFPSTRGRPRLRQITLPTVSSYITVLCDGCLSDSTLLWNPEADESGKQPATGKQNHGSIFGKQPQPTCAARPSLFQNSFVVLASDLGTVVTTNRSDRFDLDEAAHAQLDMVVERDLKILQTEHFISGSDKVYVTYNPVVFWYRTVVTEDLVGAAAIDKSLRTFFSSFAADHPIFGFYNAKLATPGILRQELTNYLGSQIAIGITRVVSEQPIVLAKQFIALARHVVQGALPSADDDFDPVLDSEVRQMIIKGEIPTNRAERAERDRLILERDAAMKSRTGRRPLPALSSSKSLSGDTANGNEESLSFSASTATPDTMMQPPTTAETTTDATMEIDSDAAATAASASGGHAA